MSIVVFGFIIYVLYYCYDKISQNKNITTDRIGVVVVKEDKDIIQEFSNPIRDSRSNPSIITL
jgi:hypothetical protein